MSRVADAEVYVAVVDAGGFTAAARALGLSQPAVSRRVTALEARLGVRLLVRATRQVRDTDAGLAFYERCRRLLGELDEAESEAAARGTELRGALRLTAPPAYGRAVVVPQVAAFSAAHPGIDVELLLTERQLDLLEEGIDLAVRLPDPGDRPGLIHTRLAEFALVACAAPSYLESHGVPRRPAELSRHVCLVQSGRDTWRFARGGERFAVRVRGPLRSNDVEALCVATRRGAGIAVLPEFLVGADLRSGALRPVLGGFAAPRVPVYAVYAERRHMTARVRALLDFLLAGVAQRRRA